MSRRHVKIVLVMVFLLSFFSRNINLYSSVENKLQHNKNNINKSISASQLMYNIEYQKFRGKSIHIKYYKKDLYEVLLEFRKISEINFYIDSNIKGIKISGIIDNIPWDKALSIFLEWNELEALLTRGIIRIRKIRTLFNRFFPFYFFLIFLLFPAAVLWIIKKRKRKQNRRGKKIRQNSTINPVFADECLKKIWFLLEKKKIYRDENMSLQTMANELSLPPYQLSIIINERMGKSFSRLINDFRIKEAESLLTQPLEQRKKIIDVALLVGYSNKTNFNKIFKKYTGKTPSQYSD